MLSLGGSETQRTFYIMARTERDRWITDKCTQRQVIASKRCGRGRMAVFDDSVGQKGRALAAQLYAKGKTQKHRRRSVSSAFTGGLDISRSLILRLCQVARKRPHACWIHSMCPRTKCGITLRLTLTKIAAADQVSSPKSMAGPTELWIRAEALVISEAYYARIMKPARRIVRRVSRYSALNRCLHMHHCNRSPDLVQHVY